MFKDASPYMSGVVGCPYCVRAYVREVLTALPGSKTAFFVFRIARGAHVREALTILLRSRVDFFVVKIAPGADCRLDIIMVIFL